MIINPIGDEAGPLRADDQLILFSRTYPGGAQPLPINPPAAPPRAGEKRRNERATPPRRRGHSRWTRPSRACSAVGSRSSPGRRSEAGSAEPVEVEGCTPTAIRRSTARMLDRLPGLKVISNYGVGVDHIDLADASARGIPVGNTPGVLEATTADLGFALLLASARRIVEGDRYAHSPEFLRYDPGYMLGREVHGKTLGIIGMGQIGHQVARRAIGFEMTVLYHNRQPPRRRRACPGPVGPFRREGRAAGAVRLRDALRAADRPDPRPDRQARAVADEADATLINIARGAVVDTEALTEALADGPHRRRGPRRDRARAAAPRPPPPGHAQVIITPHLGSATVETRRRMAELSVENLLAGLQGEPLPHLVTQPRESGKANAVN